jgi:hypothetical protein
MRPCLLLALVSVAACSGAHVAKNLDGGAHDLAVVDLAVAHDFSVANDAAMTSDAGSGQDARFTNDAALSPACPTKTPSGGCTTNGLTCEYGNDILLSCDTLATCTGSTWQIQLPSGTTCRGATGGDDVNCPATSGAVPVGQACTPQMTCGYGTTICYCYIDHSGAPQDWGCFPGAGCPFPRPRVGSVCATSGLQCEYSSCGDSIECTGGLWTVGNGGCHP